MVSVRSGRTKKKSRPRPRTKMGSTQRTPFVTPDHLGENSSSSVYEHVQKEKLKPFICAIRKVRCGDLTTRHTRMSISSPIFQMQKLSDHVDLHLRIFMYVIFLIPRFSNFAFDSHFTLIPSLLNEIYHARAHAVTVFV